MYLLYGTAHARSLTAALETYGITVNSIIVNPLDDYKYLDKTSDLNKNYPRRVGEAAFKGLFGSMFTGVDEIMPIVSEGLTSLDNQTMNQFVRGCMKIRQTKGDDPEIEWDKIFQLLNDYDIYKSNPRHMKELPYNRTVTGV